MGWDIGKTLDLVEAKFGRPLRMLANAPIQSTRQRVHFAHIHYHQMLDDLEAYRHELGDRPVIAAAYGIDREARGRYETFMERAGAHALASVQSIHAVADLLAASVFMSLNLSAQGKAVAEHEITYQLTLDRLAPDPKNAAILTLMKNLKADAGFKHVDALSNKAKHSSIVRPVLSEDFTVVRDERLEVKFQTFERKGVTYPEGSIADVLGPGYTIAAQTMIDVGNELIQVLT